jgi:hypothetical protein
MAAHVRDTLGTAIEVLDHLERSLQRAGFGAGAPAYAAMSQVLIGQRVWADAQGVGSELQPRFAAVAAHARTIHALLQPYADAMLRLVAVAGEASSPSAAGDDDLAARVLRTLAANGGPASLSALKAQLGCAGDELKPVLQALAAQGALTCRRSSGRDVYALSSSAARNSARA